MMSNLRLFAGLIMMSPVWTWVSNAADNERIFSLEEIFEIAETNSSQIEVQRANVKVSEAGVPVAKNAKLPDIDGTLSLSHIGDGFTTTRGFKDYQRAEIPHLGNGLGVSVEQPIYTGGAIKTGIEIAELQNATALHLMDYARDDVRMRLASYYFDIYKFRNLLAVTESNIIQAEEVLDDMRARFEEGVIIENDITRYELLISNLHLQKTNIENTINILNNNLVTTAGLEEGIVIIPDSTILERVFPKETEEWWQNEAETNSPELKIAENHVRLGKKGERMVLSDKLPKIGLKAAWSIDGPILTEIPPINRNLSYWYVGVGVSYELSSLYKSRRKEAEARRKTYAAEAALENSRNEIAMRVKNDYVQYSQAYETLKTRIKGVELAEKNYSVTKARYEAEMALITDMVDAATSKLDAEQQLINTKIDIIHYYYKLLYTTGRI